MPFVAGVENTTSPLTFPDEVSLFSLGPALIRKSGACEKQGKVIPIITYSYPYVSRRIFPGRILIYWRTHQELNLKPSDP